jgi:hypothetical protein
VCRLHLPDTGLSPTRHVRSRILTLVDPLLFNIKRQKPPVLRVVF